jgi:hypothetical protein
LLIALDHLLHSYYFVWPFTFVALVVPPCLAAHVNARRALALFQPGSARLWAYLTIGAIVVLLPPAAAQFAEARWLATVDHQLRANDAGTVEAGLGALNNYPLRMGRFDNDVCEWIVIRRTDLWYGDADLTAQLTKMFGPDFWHCVPRDPRG